MEVGSTGRGLQEYRVWGHVFQRAVLRSLDQAPGARNRALGRGLKWWPVVCIVNKPACHFRSHLRSTSEASMISPWPAPPPPFFLLQPSASWDLHLLTSSQEWV